MKAKDIASQLGSLAAATGATMTSYGDNDIDQDLPLDEPDPIFIVEHDDVIEQNRKKALKSIQQIVNTIVPKTYQDNPIISDKIEQDADQLGQLYYQQNMNNVMIKAIMDTISKGDTSSKLFDSYTKLMGIAKDFNKQINEMQNQFRKYYIDTYLDLQHKEDEDLINEESSIKNNIALTNNTKAPQPVIYQEDTEHNIDRRETSTKDSVLKIQDWKKEQYRKMYEQKKGEE